MFENLFEAKILNHDEEKQIVEAIRLTELKTTGEIHVHVSRQKIHVDGVIATAMAVFQKLKLHETKDRNGVLIYINSRAHEFALLGDQGIHQLMTTAGWENAAAEMSRRFKSKEFAPAILAAIQQIGGLLTEHFPAHPDRDNPNELSDQISKS